MIIVSVLILSIALILTIAVVIVDWSTHVGMVKDHSNSYGRAGHKEFIKQFNQVDWKFDSTWQTSLFGENHSEDYYHAGVIRFNYNGMLISNPISYLIVKLYVKKYIELNHSKTKANSWR